MPESLPYLSSPGSITTCLEKISNASTPEKVTGDFINTKLAIKGGTGRSLPPFLKKIGFVNSDGTPSSIYKKFRNPAESGVAVAQAIRKGYAPLYESNENAHELDSAALKGLIVQVTGQEPGSSVVNYTLSTFKKLKDLADFDANFSAASEEPSEPSGGTSVLPSMPRVHREVPREASGRLGMNLSYTINLNLPATSDISVFNAIFKSLKENLLQSDESE